MEGIVATRRQTLAVMDAMRINESINKGEIEIRNALAADEFVHSLANDSSSLDAQLIRELNKNLMNGIREDAGIFRAGEVTLPGAPFQPPNPLDVPGLIHDFCNLFAESESLHPIVQAVWIHAQFTLIHPFSDGTGRGGRLLQDWALMRRGFLPAGIPPSRRDDYYSALEQADNGEWDELVEIIALQELTVISQVEAIVVEQASRANWVRRLSAAAAKKHDNAVHKQYLVWRKRMEGLSRAFNQAAQELDESSDLIGATFKDFGVLEYASWEKVVRYGQSERSWLFSILFFAEGRPFYKTIGYLKRHVPLPSVDLFPPANPAPVALYLTGTEATLGGRANFLDYEDPHIRLRELLFHNEKLYCYTQANPEADWEVEGERSQGSIIEDFFTDVFERKASIGA